MSEDNEGADEREQVSDTSDTAGLAIDLAMEQARSHPALRDHVAAFLDKQTALVEIQKNHLHERLSEQLRQLRLGTWEKRLGVLLHIATAFGRRT